MKTRQINYPLYLGGALSFLFLVLAVFGPYLAPHDPMEGTGNLFVDGVLYASTPIGRILPPFKTATYPLGLDFAERDVLSRLLWAIRPTLILCSLIMLLRLAIGVLLGLVAGWFRRVGRVVDALITVSVSIPLLVVAIAAISVIGIRRGILTFVIALTLTGWCDTAALVKNQTRGVLQAPYIESGWAIGRSRWGILWHYVLPQLRPVLPVLMAFELSAVLLVVAELGYLGYYVGGGFVYEYLEGNFNRQYLLMTGSPELGQMLSNFFAQLYRAPWISLSAGAVVALQLTAFTLLGEGLRRRLDVTRLRRGAWRSWLGWIRPQPVDVGEWVRRGGTAMVPPEPPLPVGRLALAAGTLALLVTYGVVQATVPLAGTVANESQAPPIVAAVSTPGSATTPVPTVPVPTVPLSTTPVPASQLAALNLEDVLLQTGDLPESFTKRQVSKLAPFDFRNAPKSTVQAMDIALNNDNLNAGNISVVLYSTITERDQAYDALVAAKRSLRPPVFDPTQPTPTPEPVSAAAGIGEQAVQFGVSEHISYNSSTELAFKRCAAVMLIKFNYEGSRQQRAALARRYAQRLDARLAPLICQPL